MSLQSAKLHQFHEMRKITLIKIWWYLKIYVNCTVKTLLNF